MLTMIYQMSRCQMSNPRISSTKIKFTNFLSTRNTSNVIIERTAETLRMLVYLFNRNLIVFIRVQRTSSAHKMTAVMAQAQIN